MAVDGTQQATTSSDRATVSGQTETATAILVLGMHRSGTSAMTRVISFLGADLPRNLKLAGAENAKGFFESDDLVPIHKEFLASCGSRWDDWRPLDGVRFRPQWDDGYSQRILDVLHSHLGTSSLFVLKDPRICRFAPLWLDVLRRFPAIVKAVLPIRHPLEVAASLKTRNGFGESKSLLLWLRHLLDAEHDTRHLRRSFVRYDSLLAEWPGQVERITTDLDIKWPRKLQDVSAEVDQFLTTELRHHSNSDDALQTDTAVVNWVRRAYAAASRIIENGDSAETREEFDGIRFEFNEACTAFAGIIHDERAEIDHRLEDSIVSLRGTVAAIDDRVRDFEQRVVYIDRYVAQLDSGIETLCDTVQRTDEAELASLQQQVEALKDELAAVQQSSLMNRLKRLVDRIRPAGRHYHRDKQAVESSDLFDRNWYLEKHRDVRRAAVDPLDHYLRFGAGEGRSPGPHFDTMAYMKEHPGLVETGENPLVHFLAAAQKGARQ